MQLGWVGLGGGVVGKIISKIRLISAKGLVEVEAELGNSVKDVSRCFMEVSRVF